MKGQAFPLIFKSGDRPSTSRLFGYFVVMATLLGSVSLGELAQAHSVPLSTPSFAAKSDVAYSGRVTAEISQAHADVLPEVASGTYLFGDTHRVGQLGREYLVMQVEGQRVVGGLYEAGATFSCVNGSITAEELNLTVQDPQRPAGSFYRVPIYLDQPSERSRFILPYENTLGLQGSYRIEEEDAESRRVLEFCRTSQLLSQRYEQTYSFLSSDSILPMGFSMAKPLAI